MGTYQSQFDNRTRDLKNEDSHQYAEALKDLIVRAYPDWPGQMQEHMLLKQFERGQPSSVRRIISCNPAAKTLDELVTLVSRFEASLQNDSIKRVGQKPGNSYVPTVNLAERYAAVPDDADPEDPCWDFEPSTVDVNQMTGKFQKARQGYNGSKSKSQGNKYSNSGENHQRMEGRMDDLQRALEEISRQLRAPEPAPMAQVRALPAPESTTSLVTYDEGPTVCELMAMLGVRAPSASDYQAKLECWFCHDKGHRYGQCKSLKDLLLKRVKDSWTGGQGPNTKAVEAQSKPKSESQLN